MRITLEEFENRLQQVSEMTAEAAYGLYADTGLQKALDVRVEAAEDRVDSINAFEFSKTALRAIQFVWVLRIDNLYNESEALSLPKTIENAKLLLTKINNKRGPDLEPLTKEKLHELLEVLERHKEAKTQLRIYRDQYIAHRDPRPRQFKVRLESSEGDIYNSSCAMLETAFKVIEELRSYCLLDCWKHPSQGDLEKSATDMIDTLSRGFPSEENPLPPPL